MDDNLHATNPKSIKVLLTGYGTVGREFVRLLPRQAALYEQRYGLRFQLVGIAGRNGFLYETEGLNLETLLASGQKGSEALLRYAESRQVALQPLEELAGYQSKTFADVLVESTPTDLVRGEPGLSYIQTALTQGLDVVAISKGALVTQFEAIMRTAASGSRIRYSGATAAALPTLDIGDYALAGCSVQRIEGILNGTTNYILTSMAEQDLTFEEALRQAQQRGIAETNPQLDISGLDSACKLVLLSNSLLGTRCTLGDIEVAGIEQVTRETIAAARQQGGKLKLLATAIVTPPASGAQAEAHVRLEVAPRVIGTSHPLYGVDRTEKGIVFHTDLMGTVAAIGGASSPVGAAAAAWKDLINLYR